MALLIMAFIKKPVIAGCVHAASICVNGAAQDKKQSMIDRELTKPALQKSFFLLI
jgi:hypothetical protein